MTKKNNIRKTTARRGLGFQRAPTRSAGENRATMAGYSGTPLWKKLGYRDGMVAFLDRPPAGYAAKLQLPGDISVQWARQATTGIGFVHLFTTSKSALSQKLQMLRKTVDPAAVVWVSWPKKSAGVTTNVTEDVVREVALPLGFVDIKVCAVDEIWSGLKLVIRKELR